mmetsp:Transcript_7900/g.11282  ORF Transcript_7900/g.11282 Transcript_7900/m.11282 type:complete len:871 (-) Transcript_7900:36-2648(-)
MGASASREKFRESVTALIKEDVSPDYAEFWDELWKIPSSPEEVFELLSPESARKLRDERFDNLATLFTQATAQLCQIVETPYNNYFDQALNCVRVLTRILPFLLEKGDLGDSDPNVEHLCWGIEPNRVESEGDSIVGRVIGGDDDDGFASPAKTNDNGQSVIESKTITDHDIDDDDQEPLALLVIHAAMHMLFLPQFTCDFYDEDVGDSYADKESSKGSQSGKNGNELKSTKEKSKKESKREQKEAKENDIVRKEAGLGVTQYAESGVSLRPKPASIVWTDGCGVSSHQLGYDGGTRKYDKNRVEVLRLLLSACCDPLFSNPDEYNPLASRWLAVAVGADAPNSICLFYSLLNTILSYDPNGIGVPYSSTFASDAYVRLVELSSQVLCVLLDCGVPGSPVPVRNAHGEAIVEFDEASKTGFNIFRTLLARIDSVKELTFIYYGFARLLRSVYESKNTYLPNSTKSLHCFQEVLILFWKMLEENPIFMSHILTECDITEIVVPVCYLLYQSRKDPAQVGLVHICTFILLKLSGERSFGVNLNKPFNTSLPCDIPLFSGGHADLIAISLHKIVVNGSFKFVSLYSCFVTVICNISPYWRKMSLVAAVKLVNLFELFSSPKFLYSGEKSYKHLSLLLEVFNNIIQYQYHDSQHLVYAILRRKDSFGRLSCLTLSKAKAQCKQVYGRKTKVQYDADASVKRINIIDKESLDKIGNMDSSSAKPPHLLDKNSDSSKSSRDDLSDISSVIGDQFYPSEKWIAELKETLPIETITRLLQHLAPVVDEIVHRKQGVVDEVEILEVLKNVTMVGLLPVPHAIVVRKYQPNQYTALWFTAFLWGVIFVRNQGLPIFDGEAIRIFKIPFSEEQHDSPETKK